MVLKKNKPTVREIQKCIYSLYKTKGYKYFSSNSFGLGEFEVDFVGVHPENMFCVEFEIKMTKSDFRADFKKKNKHELLKKGLWPVNQFFFVAPRGVLSSKDIPRHLGLITVDKIPMYRDIVKKNYTRSVKYYKYDIAIEKKAKVLHQRELPSHLLVDLLTSVMNKYFENHIVEI